MNEKLPVMLFMVVARHDGLPINGSENVPVIVPSREDAESCVETCFAAGVPARIVEYTRRATG